MVVAGASALGVAAAPFRAMAAGSHRLVALGDSLTAGLGVAQGEALPAQLERALRARGHDVAIANAGVSGDTSSGGLARLDWSVPGGTDGVILALGANDALRGIEPSVTRKALDAIMARLGERGIAVLVAGMRAPPNMGADYAERFDAIFPDLARQHDAVLYPFLLEGVAADRSLNQKDGIHPTAQGVARMVEGLLPPAEQLIGRIRKRPAPPR